MTHRLSPLLQDLRRGRRKAPDGLSNVITRFSGSMTFVWIHVAWFALWIGWNVLARPRFDPFPFGLLTLIVSLEAIFLSTFVLISQNEQAATSDNEAKQDFRTNLYSEALSELIAEKLGIDETAIEERYRARQQEAEARVEADAPSNSRPN